MLKKAALAATLLSLFGCSGIPSPDTVCAPKYKVTIPDAELPVQPSTNTKVAILPVEVNFRDQAASKVAVKLRKAIEHEVDRTGAKLLDRELADKLAKEISIAEANNETSTNTSATASSTIVIASEINSIDYSTNFTEGHVAKNIFTGDKVWIKPSCSYKVSVKTNIRLIDRATGNVLSEFDLEGDNTTSKNTRSSKCNLSVNEYASMATKAANESLTDDASLRNALAPSAPVLELRQCEEGAMVLVDMGKNLHIAPATPVNFYNLTKGYDDELVPTLYGKGEVVDVSGAGITRTKAWVAISDETAKKVQKGDKAQITFKNCDSLLDIECQLNF